MAGLQQLRKRLKSIRATGQLAEAMRTAATIKYSRVSKVREEFTPYAGGSAEMLSLLGRFGSAAKRTGSRRRTVLFCSAATAGFAAASTPSFSASWTVRSPPRMKRRTLFRAAGKASAYLRERSLAYEEFILSDVPDYEETHAPLRASEKALYHGAR